MRRDYSNIKTIHPQMEHIVAAKMEIRKAKRELEERIVNYIKHMCFKTSILKVGNQ